MLNRLHGRTQELRRLQQATERSAAGEAQLVVVSGHRRVGKTFLLLHLLQRLPAQRTVFFSATQQSEAVELDRFTRVLQEAFPDEPLLGSGGSFPDWERALEGLVTLARQTAVTAVIDEAPYLTRSTPGFASIVQAVWDRAAARAEPIRLTLVLTGSAASVMEHVVGPDGPLRGRAADHLRLRPFELSTVARVLDVPAETAIQAYAVGGGWPLHVAAWDVDSSMTANLERLAAQPGGLLLEDADLILRELPEGPGFGRVLAAIGRGRTKFGEIATQAGQRVEYPLAFLADSGLIVRETPVGAPRRARPQYRIADPYLRFWFHVLYNDRARIEGGLGRAVLDARQQEVQTHLGWVFEEQARAHARRLVADGHLDPSTIVGRWWSTRRNPVEVDVLGLQDGRTTLVGEAKWSSGPFDPRWIRDLHTVLERVPDPAPDAARVVWTRAGPPADLPAGVTVYQPEDMIS